MSDALTQRVSIGKGLYSVFLCQLMACLDKPSEEDLGKLRAYEDQLKAVGRGFDGSLDKLLSNDPMAWAIFLSSHRDHPMYNELRVFGPPLN